MPLNRNYTRFNPSVNGPLHVGHIYLCLVNEYEAHASDGKFFVRFEDDQPEYLWKYSPQEIGNLADSMKRDLDWLGINVDEYLYQTEMREEMESLKSTIVPKGLIIPERFTFDQPAELTSVDFILYPYAPHLTAERVLFDALSHINLLIRGEDLQTDFSLYMYFCDIFKLTRPRQVYIPRMGVENKDNLLPELSKTNCNYKIESYREAKVSPEQLLEYLRVDCLVDPSGEWSLKNIKRNLMWNR